MNNGAHTPLKYDVVILGAGMAGTMLGAILARNGAKVAIIDSQRHPRFAVGEATIRETTMMIKILAERFQVPELHNISSFVAVTENVANTSGMKRHISYAYHSEGERQRPHEYFQVVVPETFEGPEVHYFRQDTDQYLVKVAEQYGCAVREGIRVQDIDIGKLGASILLADETKIQASYVVDATGYKSILADKLGLREHPPRFRSNTRSIFTHMTGVKRYEDCSLSQSDPSMQRWSQGTLHHCFDGGWIWVIPFNNGPQGSNPLISVGLQFDNRKHPFTGVAPEDEFKKTISRFPSVAEQFEGAQATRPWVSSFDRLQYSSTQSVGDRWCLMSHAAGFLDPLFSRGLVLTMRTMLPTAELLLGAIEDGDFSAERFAKLDEIQQRTLDNIDVMVEGMYTSWRDFKLFDAFARFWYSSGVLGFFQIESAYSFFRRTGDRDRLRDMLYGQFRGSLCSALPQFQPYFAQQIATIQAVDAGTLTAEQGAAEIMRRIREADFLPPGFHFDNLEKRHGGPFNLEHWRRIQTWGNYQSPKEVKDSIYPGESDGNFARFMDRVDAALKSDRLASIRRYIAETNPARS